MTELAVPWGDEELRMTLPESWTLQQVAAPELKPAPKDWPDRLAGVLLQPNSGPSLEKLLQARRDGKIVLLVEDVTRHSPLPQILEIVIREILHAGIASEQVEIFFSTGMHPAMTASQAAEKLGPFASQFAWRSNPWGERKAYVRIGKLPRLEVAIDRRVADADLRIIVSSVSPHLQAGFGGGYKMFLPGCASLETIRSLHRLGITRSARQLVGIDMDRNPMRVAMDSAGEMIDARHGRTFAVQYVLDGQNLPTIIAAGEVLPTQRMLAKQCAVACGVIASSPADVLVTNAFPRDFDLWQSFKCIANTLWAARRNGIVICVSRCPAGLNGMKTVRWPLTPSGTRKVIKWLGPETLASLVTRLAPSLAGDAAFFIRLATQMLGRNVLYMVSPVLAQAGAKFPGLHIFGSMNDAFAAARKQLGEGPQRVAVFPMGGVTYPVPAVTRPNEITG